MVHSPSRFLAGLLWLAGVGAACRAGAETNDSRSARTWEHYQLILEKNPFGRMEVDQAGVTPDFAKGLRMCMLVKIPDPARPGQFHSRAGFVGPVATNQFTVQDGELTEEGYSIEEINHAEQKVKLRKGHEVAAMTVEGLPVPTNAMASVQMQTQVRAMLQNPQAWRMMHEASRTSSGEVIPAHVHLPGMPQGTSSRFYLSDDQVQDLRRQRDRAGIPPNTPFPR